jgi:hypothetical protein
MRFWVVLLLLGSLSQVARADDVLTPFESKDGNFRVLFPGDKRAVDKMDPEPMEHGGQATYLQTGYMAYFNGSASFSIAYTDYPKQLGKVEASSLLQDAERSFIKFRDAKLFHSQAIRHKKTPGREATIREPKVVASSEDTERVVRFYLAGQRLYRLSVTYGVGWAPAKQMAQFFESFSQPKVTEQ